MAGRGARLNQLERAGFRTVADLLDAPAHALHAVPGVGPQTVQQVVEAARLAAAQVHRDTRFRFDPDRRDPGQTQLLATLAAIRAADSTVASLRQPLQIIHGADGAACRRGRTRHQSIQDAAAGTR